MRGSVKKWVIGIACLAMCMFGLTACFNQAKAYPSECALVVGKGYDDAHKVKKVVYPGGKVDINGDEEIDRLPCNSRNYIVTNNSGGDLSTPLVAYTAASATQSSMQDNITLSLYFGLNQNENILKTFLPFCEKYNCYATSSNGDLSKSNYATPGWNAMLKENFKNALERASIDVTSQFGPDLWETRADWPKLATALSGAFMKEVKKGWATETTSDFFCGDTTGSRNGACNPVQISIDNVTPTDHGVIDAQNAKNVLNAQTSLNLARIAQAKLLYGPYWAEALRDQDMVAKCAAAGQTCIFVVGADGKPSVSVSPPTTPVKKK